MPEGWRAGDGHWTACYRTLRGRLNIDLSTRPATIHVDGPLEPVPLNTAPLGLLIQLPEIGRKRAEAIITRRTALGGFKTLGQLSRVAHLNAKAIESLHAHCTLRRSSMLSRSAAAATRSATPRPPAR
jgi:predicted DNA-binding helix-hairpin-helix protein